MESGHRATYSTYPGAYQEQPTSHDWAIHLFKLGLLAFQMSCIISSAGGGRANTTAKHPVASSQSVSLSEYWFGDLPKCIVRGHL